MSDRTIVAVFVHPSTRKAHAVIKADDGYRLACRPNTPTKLVEGDLLDYRYAQANKCWNEACWRHFLDPEGR